MKTAHDIIIRPIITEAAMDMIANKTYVFEVRSDATKPEIAKAVEELFKGTKVAFFATSKVYFFSAILSMESSVMIGRMIIS